MRSLFNYLICIMASLLLDSCAYFILFPYQHVRNFDTKDQLGRFSENSHTELGKRINLHGYYTIKLGKDRKYSHSSESFFLFDDGTWADFHPKCFPDSFLNTNKYKEWEQVTNFFSKNNLYGCGGYYEYSGDTIYVDNYHMDGLCFGLARDKYVIEDSCHIRLVRTDKLFRHPENNRSRDWEKEINAVYEFVPMDSLPSSSNLYFKQKRWLWTSKKDWKAFKKQMKAKRKNTLNK